MRERLARGRRRAVRALLRADRRQPAPGARAARGDRAAAAPGRRRRAGRRRGAGGPLAGALGAAPARGAVSACAGAGAGGRGVRGRRAAAPRGRARRPPVAAALAAADELARADLLRRRRPARASPIRSCGRRCTAALSFGERARTHRRAARAADRGRRVRRAGERAPARGRARRATTPWSAALRATARRALAQGVPASAVRYLERALREPPAGAARADVLAELGRAEAAAGRPTPSRTSRRRSPSRTSRAGAPRCASSSAARCTTAAASSEACGAFARGRDELGETARELAVDLAAGYLTVGDADPGARAPTPTRGAMRSSRGRAAGNRAERALASKAMIMRAVGGGTARRAPPARARALRRRAPARRGRRRVAGAYVTWSASLSLCDEYAAAETALELMFADARRRGSATMFAAASQLRARQRLWTGPIADAVEDARAAVDVRRGACRCTCTRRPTAWSAVCSSRTTRRGRGRARPLDGAAGAPSASSPPGAARRPGASPPQRGDARARRWRRSSRPARARCDELLAINPTVLPWRSEAGLAAQRLGRHEQARELIAEELRAGRALRRAARDRRRAARGRAARARRGGGRAAARGRRRCSAGCGARVEHARALAELGAAIRRAGRPGEARDTLREAIALAEATGADALARRAARGAAARRRARPGAPPTARQRPDPERAARGPARGRRAHQPRRSPTSCS